MTLPCYKVGVGGVLVVGAMLVVVGGSLNSTSQFTHDVDDGPIHQSELVS